MTYKQTSEELERLSALANLTKLSLQHIPEADGGFISAYRALHKLDQLLLVHFHKLNRIEGVSTISSLKNLTLDSNFNLQDDDLALLANSRGLRSFTLANSPQITANGLQALSGLSQLTFLKVDNCPKIPESAVEELANKLTALSI